MEPDLRFQKQKLSPNGDIGLRGVGRMVNITISKNRIAGETAKAIVCLVRPLLSPSDFNGYPLNLLILGSALINKGHSVAVFDCDFLKEIDDSWTKGDFAERAAREVAATHPDFVGITSMCSNYVLALDFAQQLKNICPETHITFGGPHVSLCALETLERHPYVDTAVIGEGEITYPALIECVQLHQDLSHIEGIAYRKCGVPIFTEKRPLLINLNASPKPVYDLVDVQAYAQAAQNNYLEVYAGSGCPFNCTFCSTSIVWERKYRTMSAERIVSEIEELNKRYGANAFNLIHDNLSSDRRFLAEIAQLLLNRKVDIRWGFSSRIDTLDKSTIALVAEAGCDYVFFGVESGSSAIQKVMGKRLKLSAIHEVIEDCITHGISPTTSFILGFPEEDVDDVRSTIRLAFSCKVQGARRSFINLLSPYTGTPVVKRYGEMLYFDALSLNSTMISFLNDKHLEIIESDPFIFSNYYSFNYTGVLSASDYLGLVDFFTICLFRFAFSISYLINNHGVDPIALFETFSGRMRMLTTRQRNMLDFEITWPDIQSFVAPDKVPLVRSLYEFDHALWLTGTSKNGTVLYSGPVSMTDGGGHPKILADLDTRHYLLSASKGTVHACELDLQHSLLYEVQGLPAVRAAVHDGK